MPGPLYAALTGIPVVRAMLVIPFSGMWHADVTLDRAVGVVPTGPQVLTLAGTTWACAPIRAIDYTGTRQVRLVGGTGGWRSTVPFQEYASPIAGVPTATVLLDAAAAAGELPPVVDPTVSPTVGPYYCRQLGPASLVLQHVLGASWWMDPTGTVQTAPRLPVPIVSPFDAIAVDGCVGRYQVATEYPGDWMPGRTFLGPTVVGTVSRVMHTVEKGSVRTEVLVQ